MSTTDKPLEVRKSEIRGDARSKATGQERFSADHYPEGHLWAGAVRAGVPSGRLLGIDTIEALKIPGVVKILTSRDVPGPNRHGIIHKDTPVLADDLIRYSGDAVALVLAESSQSLKQAIALVAPKIAPLPAVFDPQSAMAPGAPQLHESHPGNILMEAEIRKGDSSTAMAECTAVAEGEFSTPMQAHAFLETENGTAFMDGDGFIHMTVSTQSPFRDRFEIGTALGIPYDKIKIASPSLGGGFGGKDGATVQCLLVLAALHSDGRTVKMQWSREENLIAGYKRHACRLVYRMGARRDGTLYALSCSMVYDTGAYAHLGGEVMELGMEHAGGPYRIPHVLIKGKCVYTNNTVAGAMRAFGVCQVTFAFESMMDMLAEKLGMDPLELRLKNALLDGDTNCAGMRLITSTGIRDCLQGIASHPLWLERDGWKQAAPPNTLRGVGLASVFNAAGYGGKVRDSAIAKVELNSDGKIVVHNAVSDMGQGNSSAFLQIAGHILCQDAGRMLLLQPNTTTAYPSGSSSAGRTTYTFGNALIKACEALRAKLINRAGLILFTDSDRDLRLVPGKIVNTVTGKEVPLQTLAAFMAAEDRICIDQFVAPVCEEIPETSKGFFVGFPHVIFAYGAHLARIEINRTTGEIAVVDYLAITDGGAVINPAMFDQQIHGGVAQGLGYALMEDVITSEGSLRSADFSTYLIPGALDLPDIVSIPCSGHEDTGPFGMKGVGEVAMNGPLPAVANAVKDAAGIRLHHAPLTAEKLLTRLDDQQRQTNY